MHGTRSKSTTENSNSSDKLEIVKNEILSEFQNFRDEYVKDITELKSSLEELKAQNVTLKKKVKSPQHDVDEKENIIIELEKAVAEHQQYTRRYNVEIAGIPDSIDSIDMKLQSSDKKSLTNIGLAKHKIYINNNLCPYYKVIIRKASQL